MIFHCRKKELNVLNSRYQRDHFECVIIYGRRRVGKTALINEFCKNKKTIFYSALNSTAKENLESLSRAIYECNYPGSDTYPVFSSYESAFSEIGRMSRDEKLIFVIDEYPYLAAAEKSISSRLQHLIDHEWQDGNLFLILCGSSMSFMERQVLGYESPLYGRRTTQLKIEPLSYLDTAEFNPHLSAEDNALIYGITGGIPHYINKLEVDTDLDSAIVRNIFHNDSYLFEEPENLLKQELREPASYNSIISAIAGGNSRMNEISTKVGISSNVCSKYLQTLTELGIVSKEFPITEKTRRKTIYRIEDNFFRFWYRFVPGNMALITSGRIENSYERVIKSRLHDYMGLIFEKMCKEYLLYYAADLPFDLADIGQWWGTDQKTRKEVQIDIVGVPVPDENRKVEEYLIGSCKFRNEKIGISEYELMKRYADVFGKGERYHYIIFSLGGFTEELLACKEQGTLRLVTLEELYHIKEEA